MLESANVCFFFCNCGGPFLVTTDLESRSCITCTSHKLSRRAMTGEIFDLSIKYKQNFTTK